MEYIEAGLVEIVAVLQFGFEAISVFCILLGLMACVRLVLLRSQRIYTPPFIDIRLTLGSWLALGLEFQLGADILGTTVAPSIDALGQLAVIAVIRTFLNYFLSKEIETETRWQQQTASESLRSLQE